MNSSIFAASKANGQLRRVLVCVCIITVCALGEVRAQTASMTASTTTSTTTSATTSTKSVVSSMDPAAARAIEKAKTEAETKIAWARIDSLKTRAAEVRGEIDSILFVSPHVPQHSLMATLVGTGGLASLNYDYRFHRNWSASIGIGTALGNSSIFELFDQVRSWLPVSIAPSRDVPYFSGGATVPFMLCYLTNDRTSPSHLELGVGTTVWFDQYIQNNLRLFFPLSVGYRYQSLDGGFFFRAHVQGLIGSQWRIAPWVGLSIGGMM